MSTIRPFCYLLWDDNNTLIGVYQTLAEAVEDLNICAQHKTFNFYIESVSTKGRTLVSENEYYSDVKIQVTADEIEDSFYFR